MAYNLAYAARLSELTPFSTDTLALWTVVNIRWPDLAEWIRTRIAEGTIEPSDDELRDIAHPCHLLQRSEVLAVFGSKRGGPLNAATLVRYCGHVPPSEAGGTIGADTENPPTAVPVAQAAGIIVPGEILREETNPAGSLRAVIDDGVVGTG